jgi:hypothetical protein
MKVEILNKRVNNAEMRLCSSLFYCLLIGYGFSVSLEWRKINLMQENFSVDTFRHNKLCGTKSISQS